MDRLLLTVIFFHGLIHLFGFFKAWKLFSFETLPHISKFKGVLWLLATSLFLLTAILLYTKTDAWWLSSIIAIIISQYLIFGSWKTTKFGSVLNGILLINTIIGYGEWKFSGSYKNEVRTEINKEMATPDSLLTEADLNALPDPIKKYVRYSGAVGKPKVRNFKLEFEGEIRKNQQSQWMPFTSQQYNFMKSAKRLFFMKATMNYLPVNGFHSFNNGNAFMDIRLFSLFRVQYQSGVEMGIAETVTFFNDMCCMAPATLIDKRIKWMATDNNKVQAQFTNNGTSISAWLTFNDKGELVNFISQDRFAAQENNTMIKLPWSTPLQDYQVINDHRLASNADAIYTYPQGNLRYGNFRLTGIAYNCKE